MLFCKDTYIQRRQALSQRIKSGLIILMGNNLSPVNYPANAYRFRQDSSFLYYFGQHREGLVGVIDTDENKEWLIGNDIDIEDIVWYGSVDCVSDLAAQVGVNQTAPMSDLQSICDKAKASGREIHFLPPYRYDTKIQIMDLLGIHPNNQKETASLALIKAVVKMRSTKEPQEIEAIERACDVGYEMHTRAMHTVRPGLSERYVGGIVDGTANSLASKVSFATIFSQHGEIMHGNPSTALLEDGRLVLCDAGCELDDYCSDHTRTYPVNGKFTDVQKDIYNIVLRAHSEVKDMIKPGTMYPDIHRAAYLSLAEGLKGVGLIKSTAEDAVAAGAMFLFMPHGLSHGMGIDVHDCEAMGERSYDFSAIAERAAESATCIHRATWRLRAGTVMSNEPGIYFIPALIDKSRSEGLYKGIVNYDKLDGYRDFGGIRIEDDVIVTDKGGRVIGGDKKIPVTVEELEAILSR